MKIAKILTGSPDNQKGAFNNVMARISHLMEVEKDVDCYMIRFYYNWVLRLMKGQLMPKKRDEYVEVNGITFKNLWVKMTPLDYMLVVKFGKRPFMGNKYVDLFKDYDLISPHSMESVYISDEARKFYNIPYACTWHGSDINVNPFKNAAAGVVMKQFIENAGHNFFVSEKLMHTSDKITASKNKSVLYTGPAPAFKRLDEDSRMKLRAQYGITTKFVVGFVGNIIPIKNVLSLPGIFSQLQKKLNSDVSFIIVGNGGLNEQLNQQLANKGVNNIHHLGLQKPNNMPGIINTLDVLLLPSLNEGMPRVTLEAQACGVHVVGSDRGGIPESIGMHNCFALDDNFETNVANRVVEILINDEPKPTLPEKFSWNEAVKKEMEVYRGLVKG